MGLKHNHQGATYDDSEPCFVLCTGGEIAYDRVLRKQVRVDSLPEKLPKGEVGVASEDWRKLNSWGNWAEPAPKPKPEKKIKKKDVDDD